MTYINTITRHGLVARALHWLTALCMLPTLAIAVYMDTLEEKTPGDPQRYFAVLPWHKTLGVLVLCFVVVRLPWYLANRRPQPPVPAPPLQQAVAGAVHWSLYGLMIALPLLGWYGTDAGQATFKLFTIWPMPRLLTGRNEALSAFLYEIHVILGWTAVIFVALHVGAAVWHQWVIKDGLLRRMWSGSLGSPRIRESPGSPGG